MLTRWWCAQALTLHYSVLSLLLHVSLVRTSAHRYHAGSAVFMSELLKVLICTVTAFASGELVNRVAELKWEQERRVQLDEPELPTTNNQSPQDVHRRSQTATENDQGDEPDEPKTRQSFSLASRATYL